MPQAKAALETSAPAQAPLSRKDAAKRDFDRLNDQIVQCAGRYPDFQYERELTNPGIGKLFAAMIHNGIAVTIAYETVRSLLTGDSTPPEENRE